MSYIELEAAVTAVDESPCWQNSDDWFAHASVIEENLRAIPAADVRPVVRGKWVKHNATHVQKGGMYLECSCCHEYITVLGHVFAYCPNCGADMREES